MTRSPSNIQHSNSSSNLGSQIYSGVSKLGEASSWLSAIIGTLIALGLIGGGIYLIYRSHEYDLSVECVVQNDSSCSTTTTTINNQTQTSEICSTELVYSINGKKYSTTVNNSIKYDKGDKVQMWYQKKDPSSPTTLSKTATSTTGWICLGVGVFILVAVWIELFLSIRYKPFAAFEGAETIGQMM